MESQDQFKNETPKKVPYTPPTEKRFAVSRDERTQERIEIVRDLQAKLVNDFGVEIGVTLFGSITKGKKIPNEEVANATDIDCIIYFSAEDVVKNYDSLIERFPEIKKYDFTNPKDSPYIKLKTLLLYRLFSVNITSILIAGSIVVIPICKRGSSRTRPIKEMQVGIINRCPFGRITK